MGMLLLLTAAFDFMGGIPTFNRCLTKAINIIANERGEPLTVLVLNDHGQSESVTKYVSPGQNSYRFFSGNRIRFSWSALLESRKAQEVFFGHVNLAPLALCMNRP